MKATLDDDTSYVERLEDGSARSVIVFLHGFRGSIEKSWGSTPRQIMTTPSFAALDYAAFQYESGFLSSRKAESLVEELILNIRTHLGRYENIFFIAHSMGGLLVRHAVIRMLNKDDGKELVARIRMCFLIASPVEGAWLAKVVSLFPVLARVHGQLEYLAFPGVDGADMSVAYEAAAEAFMRRGGSRGDIPTFHIFSAAQDKLVFRPPNAFYTPFDHYEGPVYGSHESVKLDLDANSTLLRRIAELIVQAQVQGVNRQVEKIEVVKEQTHKREVATSEVATRQEVRDGLPVILISCSRTKSDAHGTFYSGQGGIQDSMADARIWPLVVETRVKIFNLVHQGRINGVEFKEGNRLSMRVNQLLRMGPDFGGALNTEAYLSAYRRYTGRCFQARPEDWERSFANGRGPYVLIMSGLYGLIPPTELIQNYDVHITDVDTEANLNLQAYWKDRELMTHMLLSHLEWLERTHGRVGVVIDALSELSYQETINWALVDRRWSVLHRVFEKAAGSECLGNLGVWLRDVLANPGVLSGLAPDRFMSNERFVPADRLAFERQIGASGLKVAREVRPA